MIWIKSVFAGNSCLMVGQQVWPSWLSIVLSQKFTGPVHVSVWSQGSWLGKLYIPQSRAGRLVVTKSVLWQFFRETSFRWSHFLYYSAFWKPAVILEIWWELLWVYVSQIHIWHLFFFWGEPKWKASVVVVLCLILVCHPHPSLSTGHNIPWCHRRANSAFFRSGCCLCRVPSSCPKW